VLPIELLEHLLGLIASRQQMLREQGYAPE
jgi:hypothetical protein